ncbi:DUF397 domain-containing protein [Nocardia sp. CA-107356]|uniref:DUF397 domain-containing protein n=1 Tax=Nocardia sp. CA-107356 TaxID=3239972 RepID=UPI003D944042
MDVSTTSRLNWVKATLSSSSSSCVEVAHAGRVVLVRDSKFLRDPSNRDRAADQPTISIPANRWRHFLNVVLDGGEAGGEDLPTIDYAANGNVSLRLAAYALTYTPTEWHAFRDGIQKGEFDQLEATAA